MADLTSDTFFSHSSTPSKLWLPQIVLSPSSFSCTTSCSGLLGMLQVDVAPGLVADLQGQASMAAMVPMPLLSMDLGQGPS